MTMDNNKDDKIGKKRIMGKLQEGDKSKLRYYDYMGSWILTILSKTIGSMNI